MRTPFVKAILLAVVVVCARSTAAAQTPSEINSVLLSAVASAGSIALSWPSFTWATDYTVYRKLRTDAAFGAPIATPSGASTGFTDNTTTASELYEYKVVRASSLGVGYGYVCSGSGIQPSKWTGSSDHYMGKVVLLVEQNLANAIAHDLEQLMTDLRCEGWLPIRHDVMAASSPASVRSLVVSDYNTDPMNVKAVFIVGRVPVPMTGQMDPHGHGDTDWPCDGYYAEMDGTWLDNVAPFGVFEAPSFPSALELYVGRLDLSSMSAFAGSTEAQLTSAYLQRAASFRRAAWAPTKRAIVFDNIVGSSFGPLAGGGWKSFAGLVGSAVQATLPSEALTSTGIHRADYPNWIEFNGFVDLNATLPSSSTLINEGSFMWAYASGQSGGVTDGTSFEKVGTTAVFATPGYGYGSVFNMMFGSWAGKWHTPNNILRSVLCSGHGLTNVWSGVPNWYLHAMGMGEVIGKSALLSMNNNGATYTPQSGGWQGTTYSNGHMTLLGDPTLRMINMSPPSGLFVSNNAGFAELNWTATTDPLVAGYNVYRFGSDGVPNLLNTVLITGTSYLSSTSFAPGDEYMVRAVKLETTPSGTFWNLSIGALNERTYNGSIKAILEGPYNSLSTQMSDALRGSGFIPLSEPYTTMGFAQAGGGGAETTTAGVLATTGPNGIVDWVRVEFRTGSGANILFRTVQCLVQRDGDIVSASDGTSPIPIPAGSYFVAVRHRNHLGIMSKQRMRAVPGAAVLDFTLPSTLTYGTNAQKDINGTKALWMGNVIADDRLKYTGMGNDRDPILMRIGGTVPTNTVTGYWPEDCSMDGVVKYTGANNDRDPILSNIGGTVPTSTRLEQIP